MGTLRVIAGKFKGRKLSTVPGDSTRPITDRTKESLFNIVGRDIQSASMLDLFAGTGSVGIEALSRDAEFVRFVDINRSAILTIRKNLLMVGGVKDSEVLQIDAFRMLENPVDRSFDYIYIAPPQYKNLWKKALIIVDSHPTWLQDDGWIIAQIHPIEYENLSNTNLLNVIYEFDQRKYGSTLLVFYKVENLVR